MPDAIPSKVFRYILLTKNGHFFWTLWHPIFHAFCKKLCVHAFLITNIPVVCMSMTQRKYFLLTYKIIYQRSSVLCFLWNLRHSFFSCLIRIYFIYCFKKFSSFFCCGEMQFQSCLWKFYFSVSNAHCYKLVQKDAKITLIYTKLHFDT